MTRKLCDCGQPTKAWLKTCGRASCASARRVRKVKERAEGARLLHEAVTHPARPERVRGGYTAPMTTGAPLEPPRGGSSARKPPPVHESAPPPPAKTLRDEMAMAALSALIARHRADVSWSDVAPLAYRIADDMLKARGVAP